MKNISIILNVVLFIALGALYILFFSSDKATPINSEQTQTNAENSSSNIAYVNVDSIILKYKLAIELDEVLLKKQNSIKTKLDKERADLEKEAQIFQDKVQRGIYLTQKRAEEAQQQLIMRQQELQQLEYDYSNQLGREQQKMNTQLFDSISNFINLYNTPEKYQVILAHSATSSILYGAEQLDVTNDVIEGLNQRYNNK